MLCENRVEQPTDQNVGRLHWPATNPWLTMNAQSQLDLVFSQRKGWPTGRRNGTGRERHSHGPHCGGGFSCLSRNFGQRRPNLCRRTGDLVYQDRSGQASPPRMIDRVGQGYIVRHEDDLDRDALGTRHLRGQAEVHAIARVVLDNK